MRQRSEKIISLTGLLLILIGICGHGIGLLSADLGFGLNMIGWMLLAIGLMIKHDKKGL